MPELHHPTLPASQTITVDDDAVPHYEASGWRVKAKPAKKAAAKKKPAKKAPARPEPAEPVIQKEK